MSIFPLQALGARGPRPRPLHLPPSSMSHRGASAPSSRTLIVSRLPSFLPRVSRLTSHALLLLFFSSLLLAPLTASAQQQPPASDPSRLFVESSLAYDENRLDDSIASLQQLLDSGQTLPPVLYNLGNALYRSGRLGEAIRCYRQAQWLAPRDPDIRANLGFAAQTAGIDLPHPSAPAALLLTLTTREWLLLAIASLWLLCLLGALALLLPRTRPSLKLPTLLLLLLLLLSLTGPLYRLHLNRTPEYVLQTETPLLSGPLDTATPLLSLPEGTILRALAPHPPYLQVLLPTTTPPTTGWLPSSTLLPVLP